MVKKLDWKPNSIHAFIARIDACLNYCDLMGWIEINHLKGKLKKPTPERREEIMSTEDRQRVLDASDGCFRAVLMFLSETAVRPIEAREARIEKCDLDKGVLLVPNKTKKKTKMKERPVFLSSKVSELCRTQIGNRTEGYIFLNSKGGKWTRTATGAPPAEVMRRARDHQGGDPLQFPTRLGQHRD